MQAVGSRWPKRSTRAPAAAQSRSSGPTRPTPGNDSSAGPPPHTVDGATRRRSSLPARLASEASASLREAHAVAAGLGAKPLLREIGLLAQRARLDLAKPGAASSDSTPRLEDVLGLTAREAEVLSLVARGYTNREIAATLFISVKTASVHVSHILRKLGAPNRVEAATIAHRLAPPT